MEVKPEEYAVELTEEEKKYYESPKYNTTSRGGPMKLIQEGSK